MSILRSLDGTGFDHFFISELTQFKQSPPCQYRHAWHKGDVVIWDNRWSYLKAAGDYLPNEYRIHWRVSIKDYGASC